MPHRLKSHVAAQMYMFYLPEADATSVTLIPDSFAIYPRIVKTTRPLKKELNPTDATHIAVALRKIKQLLNYFYHVKPISFIHIDTISEVLLFLYFACHNFY